MTTTFRTLVIAASAFAGGCVAHEVTHVSAAQAQVAPVNVPRWEFKVFKGYTLSDADLTEQGRQGWEIVSCPAINACFMKRPL